MQWTRSNERLPFSRLVALPSSLSGWLLAATLCFAALPEVRITESYPLCMPLFALTLFVGFVERGLQAQLLTNRALRRTAVAYFCAATLLAVSYFVNAFDVLINGPDIEIVRSYAGGLAVPTSAEQFFTGTLGDQDGPFLKLLFAATLMPLLIFAVPIRSLQEWRFQILAWTAGSLYGAAFAIAYCRGYISGHYEWAWVYLHRASGLTQHPNILGIVTLLAFPGLLLMLVECRDRLINVAALGGMAMAWWAIDYSGSRTAAGGVFILCGAAFIAQAPTWTARRRAALLVGIGGSVSLFVLQLVMPLLGLRPSSALIKLFTGRGASDAVRELTNRTALDQALDSPVFGVGYQVLEVAHNIYLQLLHAGGVFGVLGFGLTLAIPLYALLGGMRGGPQRLVCSIMFGAMATVAIVYWSQSNPAHFALALVYAIAIYVGVAARSGGIFDPLGKRAAEHPSGAVPAPRKSLQT